MASINFQTVVPWDATLADVGFADADNGTTLKGLAINGLKKTTGAPTATAGYWLPGALVQNVIDGTTYQNTGTTASPTWSLLDTSSGGLPALTNGRVWIGNGSNVATAVALSGDITTTNAGVTAIGASKVLTTMIVDANVTLAKLASGIAPSHVVKFAGKITWSGSGASLATTVAGVASTDIVTASIQGAPTQAAYIASITPTTNTITIVLSAANTSNDAVISYQVLRAAA